jgi:hypothetical protein
MLIKLFKFIALNWSQIISAIIALLTALIAIFVLIPGPEPEATLQKIVDFIKSISAK